MPNYNAVLSCNMQVQAQLLQMPFLKVFALLTLLAYVLIYGGMARLTTSRTALLQFVYPGATLVCDALVYGRWLAPGQLVGVALMALALWWGSRPARGGAGGATELTLPEGRAASTRSARAR